MSTIVLLHSTLGQRPGFLEAAERLRSRGHEVVAPDLLDGATFDDYDEAQANAERIGFPELFKRAASSIRELPPRVVYAGFSLGAACSLGAAARKPGALACIAIAGVATKAELRVPSWPAGLVVQSHNASSDRRYYDPAKVALLGRELEESGSRLEAFEYASGGHIFADPGLPDYDRGSAEAMWERIDAMLERVK
jgi:dienelactone hydrolase